ncbi:vacuolar carboxypeptidase Y [Streptomyces malaysiensis subsp. malaysiensis]|nr:vacuolar carboxypeptidase Y [Streptomyces malaysiensis]
MAAAAAGTMVVGAAGSASAHGLFPQSSGAQRNLCDTAVGTTTNTGGAAPTGDIDLGSDCVNFTNSSGSVVQANDCDTATGTTLITGAAAPTGDTTIGSNCANIAIDEPDPVVVVHKDPPKKQQKAKEQHKAKKHSHKAKPKAKDPHKAKKHHKAKAKPHHKVKVKAKKKDCKH